MNQLTTYIRTPLITISRFDHPEGEAHIDPSEETAPNYSINFIERGGYFLQVSDRKWRMSPELVFVTRPDLKYHCRHENETPTDVCFSVGYNSEHLQNIEAAAPLERSHSSEVVPLTYRLAYLHRRLRSIADNPDEILAAETLASELCRAVSEGRRNKGDRLYRARMFAWYAERVEAARALMESEYWASHSLSSLARFTGMSPFHFSRIFRELTGSPPHKYLLDVRLAKALEQLLDGTGVTETCFATGFSNLSHFIRLFRRAFGVSPSRARRTVKKSAPEEC